MSEDFELTLFDRLEMIRSVLQDVDDDTAYVSFSGGKDSTVLHYMIDEAIPHNRYARVFSNTGIEFQAIVDFVKWMAEKDDRFEIITPGRNIKKMLEEDGYPFKSKLHSSNLDLYQRLGDSAKKPKAYVTPPENSSCARYQCPKCLLYQFTEDGVDFRVSSKCCTNLKKHPFKRYEREREDALYHWR